jgi:hypothetical protein
VGNLRALSKQEAKKGSLTIKKGDADMFKCLDGNYLKRKLLSTVVVHKVHPGFRIVSAGAMLCVANAGPAKAINLYDGANAGNGLEINLTTTLSYAGFLRVNSPSAILAGPTNANGNDGDANFRHGIVGNQFEVLPVLDIRDGDFGAHFSGQAYLNTSYLGTNQNNQPGTLNAVFVAKNTDFTSATRNVNGENAQLLDAFVFGQHRFDDGQTLQVKVGRQTLFWGQSLFFPSNGISGGQAPINVITAQDTPNAQAQQVFMPVGQAVITYQPISGTTIQGYYQFEWEHDYFQGAGAYFNSADYLDKGGQSIIAASGVPGVGNEYLLRNKDLNPESQNGQFGLSVQQQLGDWDLGLYGLRYDAKAPEIYAFPGQDGVRPVSGGIAVGNYQVVYPRDIEIYGGSFSTSLGGANVAGEISTRRHMPLIGSGFGIPTATNPGNANSDPLYPVGNTLMGQVSTIYQLPGIPLDPGGIVIDAEAAMNHLLSVTSNRQALVVGHQATAAAFDIVATPTYYNVLPGLQMSFPVGISYNFLGRSQIDPSMYHGTATFDVGITATYRFVWIASLTYQDYLGKPDTVYNGDADRGYLSLNLQRTF